MRIACLQFAPQVGDVNNNLNRADAVLAKANPEDFEDLDLIVLPELAFTGYNFKSLNEISPFLEPQGSGISTLWARTTALKYDTNVIVGYPERVDVSAKWPTGPECYSSAIVVNRDGETIANYRKSFLYAIDETWALEGEHGFFAGDIPGLGSTAMGICMDLNPYRFETPWRAFEFAYHIQAVEANLVIVTMAWLTREDGHHFTRMPEEPDTETLTYWVQRLEPLIRSEEKEEVIVVFCNRTGEEDELVYAGTSSVVGIKDGEVKVYGILGRGVKDLLVVDTEQGPFANLIQRPEGEDDIASQVSGMSPRPRKSTAAKPSVLSRPAEPSSTIKGNSRQRRSTPTPEESLKPRKTRPKSPRIHIPDEYYKSRAASHGTPIEESPGVATPTCPSPTPASHRPQVDLFETNPTAEYADSQYDHEASSESAPYIYDGRVSIESPDPRTASPTSGHLSEKYFWSDTQAPLKSPMAFRFPDVYKQDVSTAETPVPSSLIKIHHENHHNLETLLNSSKPYSPYSEEPHRISQSENRTDSKDGLSIVRSEDTQNQNSTPPRPSSPKSRNASRTGRPLNRRYSEVEQRDLAGTVERLELMTNRPGSAVESICYDAEEPRQGRARARKSSIIPMDQPEGVSQILDKRLNNVSPRVSSTIASPSVFSDSSAQTWSGGVKNIERTNSRPTTGNGTIRPCPRAGARSRNASLTGHRASLSQTRAGSTDIQRVGDDAKPHIEPDETRSLVWSELSKMICEVLDHPPTRDVSRGRHRFLGHSTSSNEPPVIRETHSETRRGPRVIPRAEQRFASQVRSDSDHQTPMRTISAPSGMDGPSSLHNPDDEIVAEIIFHSQERTAHSQVNSPKGQFTKATPNRGSIATRIPLNGGLSSSRSKSNDNRSTSQQSTRQQHRQGSSRTESIYERRASSQNPSADISTSKAPPLLENIARTDSNESCPTMDGASILTVISQKSSPATPPTRVFEPTTPKAMKFDPESGTTLSSISNPLPGGEMPHLDSLQQELMNIGILRPKSAIW